MESDFYYADLNIHIRVKWDKRSAFEGLTDNQLSALRQTLYLALSSFTYVRALFLTDTAELAKQLSEVQKQYDKHKDGG